MSAPDTDLDKQKKRHRPPLMGMAGVAIFAGVLLLLWIGWTVWLGGEPEGADAQIDGRTGVVEETDTGTPATAD